MSNQLAGIDGIDGIDGISGIASNSVKTRVFVKNIKHVEASSTVKELGSLIHASGMSHDMKIKLLAMFDTYGYSGTHSNLSEFFTLIYTNPEEFKRNKCFWNRWRNKDAQRQHVSAVRKGCELECVRSALKKDPTSAAVPYEELLSLYTEFLKEIKDGSNASIRANKAPENEMSVEIAGEKDNDEDTQTCTDTESMVDDNEAVMNSTGTFDNDVKSIVTKKQQCQHIQPTLVGNSMQVIGGRMATMAQKEQIVAKKPRVSNQHIQTDSGPIANYNDGLETGSRYIADVITMVRRMNENPHNKQVAILLDLLGKNIPV